VARHAQEFGGPLRAEPCLTEEASPWLGTPILHNRTLNETTRFARMPISERLPVGINQLEAASDLLDGPRWRELAGIAPHNKRAPAEASALNVVASVSVVFEAPACITPSRAPVWRAGARGFTH
jgi:hypothetical protein